MPKETKKSKIHTEPSQLLEKAKKELQDLTGFGGPVGIGLRKEKNEWVVTVEIVEKKSILRKMDILGIYEVRLDTKNNMVSYKRKELRKRGAV